ncbi:MAG: hypothetical protein A2Y40_07780 [Candidatus Margulisbacteria bacterium GWF2_35_9]|nr:MAG: hypothetical protein A2Y40_07780 [Candidatus Margulisbacteria bacterium GWF2_35_9]
MTLTTTDIKKVREIVREETADIRADIVDIRGNMLTKKDATTLMSDTANIIMEKMQDEFRAFYDKLSYTDDRSLKNELEINKNRSQIEMNSMKILYNSNRIKVLEEK